MRSWPRYCGLTSRWALPDTEPFADYFAAVLRRYPRIPARELWNEPNSSAFAKPFPDPAGYVVFRRTAHMVRALVGSLISGAVADRIRGAGLDGRDGVGARGADRRAAGRVAALAFATATQLPFVENLTWFEYRDG